MNWAHIHLALNHAPVIGVVAAFVLVAAGLARRSQDLLRAGLVAFVVVGFLAVGVYWTGEPAEEVVEGLADVSEATVEVHEEAALVATVAMAALAAVSLVGLVAFRRPRVLPRWLAAVLLIVALGPIGAAAWAANLGGRIRHPEIAPASPGAVPAAEVEARED